MKRKIIMECRYYCLSCDFDIDTQESKGKGFNKCPQCKKPFKVSMIFKEYNT